MDTQRNPRTALVMVVLRLGSGWVFRLRPSVLLRAPLRAHAALRFFWIFGVVLVCVFCPGAFGQSWDGNGVEGDPYQVWDACDMQAVGADSNYWDAHFELMADIDLSAYTGTEFNIIGNRTTRFTGVFDGNGHTISNFTGIQGLFGVVNLGGTIQNMGLIDPNVNAVATGSTGSLANALGETGTISGCYVEGGSVTGYSGYPEWLSSAGGLVGKNVRATITNCYSTASVSGNESVGGLVGYSYDSGTFINNCYSTGQVQGGSYVGGLVGNSEWGVEVTNCYSAASVSGSSSVGGLLGRNAQATVNNSYSVGNVNGGTNVGGLVGRIVLGGTISNCSSAGSVSGGSWIGGLAGENYDGIVTNCYSTASVSGSWGVGGLVGSNGLGGEVTNCYSVGAVTAFIGDTDIGGLVGLNDGQVTGSLWDAETSGRTNMCGSVGIYGSGCDDGNGKTTVQMQTESTFTDVGWDFVGETVNGPNDIWDICEGTNYPKLAWQVPVLGDFGCPDGVDSIDLGVLCEQWLFQELSADVWPEGGDGFVNFLDWAIFADGWGVTVDYDDVADFAEQWLKSGSNYVITDIAPGSDGDGITNGVDFAVLAENWLAGL